MDFPNSPVLNEVFTSGSRSWRWNGTSWVVILSTGPQGPQGPQGAQGSNDFYWPIPLTALNESVSLGIAESFRIDRSFTLTQVPTFTMKTVGSGTFPDLFTNIVVRCNGSSIYSVNPSIPVGTTRSTSGTFVGGSSTFTFPEASILEVEIITVPNLTPGADLYMWLTGVLN